jgi:hypothetical protein
MAKKLLALFFVSHPLFFILYPFLLLAASYPEWYVESSCSALLQCDLLRHSIPIVSCLFLLGLLQAFLTRSLKQAELAAVVVSHLIVTVFYVHVWLDDTPGIPTLAATILSGSSFAVAILSTFYLVWRHPSVTQWGIALQTLAVVLCLSAVVRGALAIHNQTILDRYPTISPLDPSLPSVDVGKSVGVEI